MKVRAKVKLLSGGQVREPGEVFTLANPDLFHSKLMGVLEEADAAKPAQKRRTRKQPDEPEAQPEAQPAAQPDTEAQPDIEAGGETTDSEPEAQLARRRRRRS